MFWTFLAAAAIAAALFQLSATTVWVSVLSLSLKAVFVIVAISAVGFLLCADPSGIEQPPANPA